MSFRNASLTIISFCYLVLFSSCNEDNSLNYVITGEITDTYQSQPVEGVKIDLRARVLESGTFNNNLTTVVSDFSSSDGSYELCFERKAYDNLQLELEKVDFISTERTISPDDLSPEEPFNLDLQIDPLARVELRLVNTFPGNSNDEIEFRYTTANFPQCNCCNNNIQAFQGDDVDTLLSCSVVGGIQLKWVYFVNRFGNTSFFEDSTLIEPFQTTEILINY